MNSFEVRWGSTNVASDLGPNCFGKKLFFNVMDKSNFTPNLMAAELHFLALIECIDTNNNLFFTV